MTIQLALHPSKESLIWKRSNMLDSHIIGHSWKISTAISLPKCSRAFDPIQIFIGLI